MKKACMLELSSTDYLHIEKKNLILYIFLGKN